MAFSCPNLLDVGAILACSIYIDLNEIRADLAATPENSPNTSAYRRILRGSCGRCAEASASVVLPDKSACPAIKPWRHGFLPVSLDEYLKLLDWCGRQVRGDKAGSIPEDLAPIVERLGIVAEELVDTIREFPQRFRHLAGTVEQFRKRAAQAGRRWLQGVRNAAEYFVDRDLTIRAALRLFSGAGIA